MKVFEQKGEGFIVICCVRIEGALLKGGVHFKSLQNKINKIIMTVLCRKFKTMCALKNLECLKIKSKNKITNVSTNNFAILTGSHHCTPVPHP